MRRIQELPTALPVSPRITAVKSAKVSIIWAVPLIALIVGGYLVFARLQAIGPVVTITFRDGDGVLPGQTPIRYRGVQVGTVHSVELSKDRQNVKLEARLNHSAASLAQEGSQFWIVRPQVSAAGLTGLQTIVSGPYIQVQPGSGKKTNDFIGIEKAPLAENLRNGLELTLTAPHISTLNAGAPVYTRGLEVGAVESVGFNDDATAVNIRIRIQEKYAPLVRQNSVFWNAGGLDVSLKFLGVDISAESMRSLVVGGIAFATPTPPGQPAIARGTFNLQDKLEEKWLKWKSPIPGWAGSKGPPVDSLTDNTMPALGSIATNSTH
ncbi:MAG TPA: MlaD family protein [Verrucomicrobiae bacterium]|jgi:paraquat-inducible protein B